MRSFLGMVCLFLCVVTPASAKEGSIDEDAEMGPKFTSASRYIIDPKDSHFYVYTDVEGILAKLGHELTISVTRFSGEVRLKGGKPESSTLEMKIDPNSLLVTNRISEKDRREIEGNLWDKVLDTGHYGDILFRSTEVTGTKMGEGKYQAIITGFLTLRGVTRQIQIPATVKLRARQLVAQGEFTLKQTDFKIKPYVAVGGAIKVKNELKFTFEITARPKG